MTSANSFVGAQTKLPGQVTGADDEAHQLFQVIRTEGPDLYGDYFEVFETANPDDYNIEIGEFGYVIPQDLGRQLDIRQHFSAEECATIEQLIRSLFSTPDLFKGQYDVKGLPPVRFLGGISFRPNWISQKPDK